eukprot:TRINITY_DN11004_c0_g1_i1.p1 TRINITY_DN11004_c0_g1~~TRINITY_DN11004_c0_g1_i1.p1  ORF type:complete len:628 (+),score=268.86 TRINITY_DN11004_c0_g1_i1:64-1947(+)
MLVSVVGTRETVDPVCQQLAEGISDVQAREENKPGFVGTVEFDTGESTNIEVELVVGSRLANSLASLPAHTDVIVYAVESEQEAQEVAAAQEAMKAKQPPFAVIVTEAFATDTIEEAFDRSRWFLGIFATSSDDTIGLLWTLYYGSTYPVHVLWDRPEANFTAVGWRALQRLFWYYDADIDETLNEKELLNLLRAVRGPDTTMDGVRETVGLIREQQEELGIDNFLSEQGHVTHYAWMALCEQWLSDCDSPDYWDNVKGLWNALEESGIERNGHAWVQDDLKSVRIDPQRDMLQLSYAGAQFLRSVYEEKFASPKSLWRFTPSTQYSAAGEPPWADVHGLPGSRDEPAEYSVESFISSWRFITVRKYQYLIVFVRCWGFTEDPNMLFVKKKKREFRESEKDLPNILQCLMLGSPRCGKTCLRKRLVDVVASPEDPYTETRDHSITLVPQKNVGDNEKFDLVLHEIPDKDVAALLDDPRFMSHIDAVLLCYDGDDVYSFSYVGEKYALLKNHKIPMLLLMTKVDLLGDGLCSLQDQEYHMQPNEFALNRGLCWPPAMVSCFPPKSLQEANDVEDLPLSISMLCKYPEDHIGREQSSLCCRITKITLCSTVTIASIAAAVMAVRRPRVQ